MKLVRNYLLFVSAFGVIGGAVADDKPANEKDAKVTAETAKSPLEFTLPDIDGKDFPLSQCKGDVVLIVNVASRCGYTRQYAGLQQLNEKYRDKGLRVIGVPANEFGGQEPGSNPQIKEFCSSKFGVTFDMLGKQVVKGDGTCELYKFLTSKDKNGEFGGDIRWNFTKFLVDRNGKVIARFEPNDEPTGPKMTAAIEKALAEDKPAESKTPGKA